MTQIVPVSRTATTNRGSQKVDVWLKTNKRMDLVANGDFIVSGEEGFGVDYVDCTVGGGWLSVADVD